MAAGRWAIRRGPGNRRPSQRRPPGRSTRDRGSVTAELAAALPALVLLLVVGLTAVSAAGIKIACVAAARDAALSQARGDDGESAGRRTAPHGARIAVSSDGDVVRATVSAEVSLLSRHLPGITVSSTAVAAVEPAAP
jgi:hypothetical protein